jgi:hypothetical protein
MPKFTEADSDNLRKFKKESELFHINYTRLKSKYKGQFVAIKHNKVIDHDKDLDSLTKRLGKLVTSLLVEYIPEKKAIYI